jgi:hypothetical protein
MAWQHRQHWSGVPTLKGVAGYPWGQSGIGESQALLQTLMAVAGAAVQRVAMSPIAVEKSFMVVFR